VEEEARRRLDMAIGLWGDRLVGQGAFTTAVAAVTFSTETAVATEAVIVVAIGIGIGIEIEAGREEEEAAVCLGMAAIMEVVEEEAEEEGEDQHLRGQLPQRHQQRKVTTGRRSRVLEWPRGEMGLAERVASCLGEAEAGLL
jgi:hypothetical protein